MNKGRLLTNILLAVAIVMLGILIFRTRPAPPVVHAQGGAGVFAFPGPTLGGRALVYLVDTSRQQLCVYELRNSLQLVGARSYTYDVQVTDSSLIRGVRLGSVVGTYAAIKRFVERQKAAATPRSRLR